LEVVIDGRVIEVRRLKDPEEYRMVTEAEVSVWGVIDYTSVVAHHVLIATDRRGGLVLGAFEKDTGRMVGFVFGFPAISPDGKLYHYSHMTGVIPEYRYKGLGYILKLMQREYVLKQGLDLIAWTYDPLQSPNARFNIGKLGVIVRKFYINYYGELRDSINIGMPTDRFEAEWWIKSKLVEDKLKGLLKPPTLDTLIKLGGEVVTNVEFSNNLPVLTNYNLDINSKLVLIEIPEDLSKLRSDNNLLLKWRLGLREVFNRYLNELNYVVVEFVSEFVGGFRRNYYILLREGLERILSGELPWKQLK
jgi:predicted GNAT superfamily acetyltransferase